MQILVFAFKLSIGFDHRLHIVLVLKLSLCACYIVYIAALAASDQIGRFDSKCLMGGAFWAASKIIKFVVKCKFAVMRHVDLSL